MTTRDVRDCSSKQLTEEQRLNGEQIEQKFGDGQQVSLKTPPSLGDSSMAKENQDMEQNPFEDEDEKMESNDEEEHSTTTITNDEENSFDGQRVVLKHETPAAIRTRRIVQRELHLASPSDNMLSPCTSKLMTKTQKGVSGPQAILRNKQHSAIPFRLESTDGDDEA